MATDTVIRELVDSHGGSIFITRTWAADELVATQAVPARMSAPLAPDRPSTAFGKIVAKRLIPTDATDPRGGMPLRIVVTDQFLVELAQRNSRLPFYHRNLRADELVIAHGGHTIYESELGTVDLYPGQVLFHPMGCVHRNFPDPANVEVLNILIESRVPLQYSPEAKAAWAPGQQGTLQPVDDATHREHVDMDGRSLFLERAVRPPEIVALEPTGLGPPLRYGKVDAAHLPTSGETTPWHGSTNILSAANGLRLDVARAETAPDYWHRNIRTDEVVFAHRGSVSFDTELGSLTLEPGEFTLVPRGISHHITVSADAVYFILEYPAAPLIWTDAALDAYVPATVRGAAPVQG